MAPTTITYEEAKEKIGTLPDLAPRPNANNLRALTLHLEQRLETIPSFQAPDHGYVGLVMPPEIYALRTATAWTDWPNPGPHPDPADTTAQQNNNKTIYDSNKAVYDSDQNVRRAVNDALNDAIPNAFRKPVGNQIGTKVFTVRDDPRQILADLRVKYGTATPNDKAANEQAFNQPWNPNEPIEALFDRLEECYVYSIMAKPPYTMEQLIDKAIIAIQRTGLYETALLEWTGFEEENKTWQQLKLHFEEAYEIRLASGQGTSGFHGYVNNTEAVTDDDSISSIQESLNTIHLSNNAQYAALQEYLHAARSETASLRAELAATQQAMANFTQASMRNTAPPPSAQPYVPSYVPPAVTQIPPAPMQQGNSSGGTRGRNRNNRNNTQTVPSMGIPPVPGVPSVPGLPPAPVYGQVQTQPVVHQPPFSNKTKRFNNWNVCCTCGFDVPIWHTSMTCNRKHTNPYHQDGVTRENAQAYMNAGHRVNKKGMHKNQLPSNPRPNQA